ncbi:aminotransferase class I/II-fold pyridoxal phosphate-dependent enzyme [archaeon]|nr:MAG: aminotransferase class I/II-fold pyridoxal phosphate-dependent enzyme [archaeon]
MESWVRVPPRARVRVSVCTGRSVHTHVYLCRPALLCAASLRHNACSWIVGHADLIKSIAVTNSWIQFSVSTPAQAAVAKALDVADRPYEGYPSYYAWLRAEYTRKRDILAKGLRSAGLKPVVPEGGFFIIADTRDVDVPRTFLDTPTPASGPIMRRDWATCRYLTMDVGVACIPPSAFFQEKDKELAKYMARFAFCKEDASLHEACTRLAKLKGAANKPSA